MTGHKSPRFWLVAGLILLSLMMVGTTLAQTAAEWCLSTEEAPMGCASISISPAALTGDFFSGETLLAQGANPGQVLLPPGSQRVDVKNIQSTDEGFGTLFVYADSVANVYTTAGQIRSTTVYPRKTYIRGTLNLTCDIRNSIETDSLGCQVTIDEVPQEEVLAPGAKANYILDPGAHALSVAVVGDSAILWSPATRDVTATIYLGQTNYQRPRFDKNAHLTLTNSVPGVLVDYYVDGELVATQVESADLWVAPNKSHRLEANNFFDPAANGVYTYRDAVSSAYLYPGSERTVKFTLYKTYLLGFFDLTCTIDNLPPSDPPYCQTYVDGVPLAPVYSGTTSHFPLTPGAHEVHVVLGPEDAWLSEPFDYTITIYAGRNYAKTAHYTLVDNYPGTDSPPAPPAPPPGPSSGNGTVIGVNMTTDVSTCRFALAGNGQVYNLDTPASFQIPAGSYSWQAFFGYGQTDQFGFVMQPGGTCVFTCYDTYVTTSCP